MGQASVVLGGGGFGGRRASASAALGATASTVFGFSKKNGFFIYKKAMLD